MSTLVHIIHFRDVVFRGRIPEILKSIGLDKVDVNEGNGALKICFQNYQAIAFQVYTLYQ